MTQVVERAETQEFLMHFIGSQLYGMGRFIREGRRIGVHRAVPITILRSIKWGQKILLAEYSKQDEINQLTGERETIPVANIFGYFTVDGISHTLPDDIKEKLYHKLHVTEVIPAPINAGKVIRACGSYGVGSGVAVTEEIDEIAKRIEQACRELGMNPAKAAKYFVKGALTVFPAPVVLEGQSFFRGYKRVTMALNMDVFEQPAKPRKAIFAVYDYSRQGYMKKKDRASYDRQLGDDFVDATT